MFHRVGTRHPLDTLLHRPFRQQHDAHVFFMLPGTWVQVVEKYCVILQSEGIEHSLCRMYLTSCILALAQGDYVKADEAFRDVHLQSTT